MNHSKSRPSELGDSLAEQICFGIEDSARRRRGAIRLRRKRSSSRHALSHPDHRRRQHALVLLIDVGVYERSDRLGDGVIDPAHRLRDLHVVGKDGVEEQPDRGLVVEHESEVSRETGLHLLTRARCRLGGFREGLDDAHHDIVHKLEESARFDLKC